MCPPGYLCTEDKSGCTQSSCGNKLEDSADEKCDDGNVLSGDGCSADCKSTEGCGNGYVDTALGEVCDNGPNVGSQGCSADCKSNLECGNGITDSALGELCDDGNKRSGDGCSMDCLSLEFCTNNYTDLAKDEACDDGNSINGDGCSSDCRSREVCGNGITDIIEEEACDDGNFIDGDGCSGNCRSDETCGNGIVDTAIANPEQCDDGNNANDDTCSTDCRAITGCGDGIVNGNEQCDDGNQVNDDDCPSTCFAARCGDGYEDKEAPHVEACDTGGESATCNLNCTDSRCGDGIVNRSAGEHCDTSGETPFCTAQCRFSWCGDGHVNQAAGEECEVASSPAGECLPTCKLNRCGDGKKDPGEACDDGNKNACGTCSADCSRVQLNKGFGRITIHDVSDIADGDTFSLSDGLVPRVTFEFDRSGGVAQGHVRVSLSSNPTERQLANLIEDAIDDASSMSLNADKIGTEVFIMHELDGARGNQGIVLELEDPTSISAVGMAGGEGYNCPSGTRCTQDADCRDDIFAHLVCGQTTKVCEPRRP